MKSDSQGPKTQTHSKTRPYQVTGAFLGLLGAANSLFTGIFVVSAALTPLLRPDHLTQGYAAGLTTTFSSITLIYGSFLLWKGNMRKGGVLNILATIVFSCTYLYFQFFSEPSFLRWLDPFGYFLLVPPFMSGALGLRKE